MKPTFPDRQKFRLRLVTALGRDEYSAYEMPATFTNERTALTTANHLAEEYHVSCAPVCCYVVDESGVPLFRGRPLASERPEPAPAKPGAWSPRRML